MIDMICDRTEVLGLKGRVAIGHALCLGTLAAARLEPPLERAYLIAYNSSFRDDAGLELALAMASNRGAQVMDADDDGLAVGNPADLLLIDAERVAEAVVLHPPRRLAIKRGQIFAHDGEAIYPDLDPGASGQILAGD